MTALPAAIDGLVALLATSPGLGLSGVRVDDGPWLERPSEPDVVVIGWLPTEGPTVAWVAQTADMRTDRESFDIAGLASAWDGGTVMKTVRDRADSLIEAIRAALRTDPTLGGVVSRARLNTVSAAQFQNGDGCEFTVNFTVSAVVF